MVKNLKVEYNKEIIEKFKELHIGADHIGSVLFILLALDEQRIDLLDTIDDENKARRMLLLYRRLEKNSLIKPGNEQIYALTNEGNDLVSWVRCQFEIQQEIIHANTFQKFVEKTLNEKSTIIDWIKEYNSAFPKAKQNNTKILSDRMEVFLKHFNYSSEIILGAAKMYNKHHDNEGTAMQYRRYAQYFIFEGRGENRTWDLATWCDKYLEVKDNIENQHNLQQFDIL